MERVGAATDSIFTLQDLKYLIHGGRISHMKGLIASLLNIKPMIGVEKAGGTYEQLGQARTFKGAVKGLVKIMVKQHAPGSGMRVQVLHSYNPEGAAILREQIDQRFDCTWMPGGFMSLVLGAHTGPSIPGRLSRPAVAQVMGCHSERSEESRRGQAIRMLWREILRFTAFRSE
jgi:DegV family protein with EDD domain